MLERNCPVCDKIIKYSNLSNKIRATKKNCLCKSCCINKGKYTKNGVAEHWTADQVFVNPAVCMNIVVRRFFLKMRTYRCECGNIGEWRGRPIALHMDHINGNKRDNRLENLRWLCPNCHQQTETWGRKNNERY